MLDILLIVQIVVAFLVVVAILLQRSSGGALGGLSSSSSSGVISAKAANSFLVKATMVLIGIFIVNSIILGNLSNKKVKAQNIIEKIEEQESNSVPIAQ